MESELSFELHNAFEFKHPTTILIAGPTMSGKTHFLVKALKADLIQPRPSRIIWVYGERQPIFAEVEAAFPNVEFTPEMAEDQLATIESRENNLVIIDDLMNETGDCENLAKLFTKGAHHRNLTVVFIIQNLFHQAKCMRAVSLNSHYMVLFKNPRDCGQISTLALQMYPKNRKFLLDAFEDATTNRFGYLVLDLHPATPEDLRVRTGILPGDAAIVYLPAYKKGRKSTKRNHSTYDGSEAKRGQIQENQANA